jgi:hypothetical protein
MSAFDPKRTCGYAPYFDPLKVIAHVQSFDSRLEKQKSQELFDHLVVNRQPELEHGTTRYVRESSELPAVRLNDRSTDC